MAAAKQKRRSSAPSRTRVVISDDPPSMALRALKKTGTIATWIVPILTVAGISMATWVYVGLPVPVSRGTTEVIVKREVKGAEGRIGGKIDDTRKEFGERTGEFLRQLGILTKASNQQSIASAERDIATLTDTRARAITSIANVESQLAVKGRERDPTLLGRKAQLEAERGDIERQLNGAKDRLQQLRSGG